MVKRLLQVIALCGILWHSGYCQTVINFDPKKSTTTVVSPNCQVIYSTSAIKATIYGKDLTVSPSVKTWGAYTKQLNKTDFDIGLFFKVKPSSDTVYFKIDGYNDFNFVYQADGIDKFGKPYKLDDNLNGSYSIQSKSNEIGKTGQVAVIYRAKLIDKNLNNLYCTMYYLNGQLAVKFDKDKAIYPAVLDPTVGITAIRTGSDNQYYSYWGAYKLGFMPENGTATSIKLCMWAPLGANEKCALYADTGANYPGDLIANSYAGAIAITRTAIPTQDSEWTDNVINATLFKGTTYWVTRVTSNDSAPTGYGVEEGGCFFYKLENLYATFPPANMPAGGSAYGGNISAYLTYTTGGGGAATPNPCRRLGQFLGGD